MAHYKDLDGAQFAKRDVQFKVFEHPSYGGFKMGRQVLVTHPNHAYLTDFRQVDHAIAVYHQLLVSFHLPPNVHQQFIAWAYGVIGCDWNVVNWGKGVRRFTEQFVTVHGQGFAYRLRNEILKLTFKLSRIRRCNTALQGRVTW